MMIILIIYLFSAGDIFGVIVVYTITTREWALPITLPSPCHQSRSELHLLRLVGKQASLWMRDFHLGDQQPSTKCKVLQFTNLLLNITPSQPHFLSLSPTSLAIGRNSWKWEAISPFSVNGCDDAAAGDLLVPGYWSKRRGSTLVNGFPYYTKEEERKIIYGIPNIWFLLFFNISGTHSHAVRKSGKSFSLWVTKINLWVGWRFGWGRDEWDVGMVFYY